MKHWSVGQLRNTFVRKSTVRGSSSIKYAVWEHYGILVSNGRDGEKGGG